MLDELLDFFILLRSKGFAISVEQCNLAYHLLFVLARQGVLEGQQGPELATWIAPIFCGTAEQQNAFYREFDIWLKSRAKPFDANPTLADLDLRQTKARLSLTGLKPTKSHVLAGIVVTLLTATGIWLAATVNRILKQQPDIPPVITDSREDGKSPVSLDKVRVSLEPQTVTPLTEQQLLGELSTWKRLFFRWYGWLRGISAGLPLLALLGWGLWRSCRRLQLEKQSTIHTPHERPLPIENVAATLFQSPFYRKISRGLKYQRDTEIYELDIAATVELTARMGGWPEPVERPLKSTAEFLVLIDRATFSDQQALLYKALISQLAKTDIYLDHYFFKSDPRNCYHLEAQSYSTGDASPSYFSLPDLRARHPHHDLLVFSDGAGLIDGKTGEPYQWIDLLTDWPNHFLITPELIADWGYREAVLTNLGFSVLTGNREGLERLVRIIQTEKPVKEAGIIQLSEFPQLLRQAPDAWLEGDEPPSEVSYQLRISLLQFLGMKDYYWLSACAVYPMLEWDLTVALGRELTGKDNFEDRLARLVRLPWFRFGRMPEWLRALLISRLPKRQEQQIRRGLEELLAGRGNSRLLIARAPDEERAGHGFWQRLIATLSVSRDIQSERQKPPLRDYVFLSFMSGRKPNKLAVALPKLLHPLFLDRTKPGFFFDARKLVAQGALAFVIIFGFFPSRPKLPSQPPPSIPKVEVTASPASGVPGQSYTISVQSADSQKFDLSRATLAVTPGSSNQEVSLQNISAAGGELLAALSVDRNFSGPEIPLEIEKDGAMLGKFAFNLSQLTFEPSKAMRGSTVILKITSARCSRYSLKSASIEALPSSKIIISDIKSDDCTVTARATIAADAQVGPVELRLKRAASISLFNLNVTSPDCPRIVITRTIQQGGYQFTSAVQGGQLVTPKFTWTLGERSQQGHSVIYKVVNFKGQGTATISFALAELPEGLGDSVKADVTVSDSGSSCQQHATDEFYPDAREALFRPVAKGLDDLVQAISQTTVVKRTLSKETAISRDEEKVLTNLLLNTITAAKDFSLHFNGVKNYDDALKACQPLLALHDALEAVEKGIGNIANADARNQLTKSLDKAARAWGPMYQGLLCH